MHRTDAQPGADFQLGFGAIPPTASGGTLPNSHERVIQFTQTLFPGPVAVRLVTDPEVGDQRFQVKVEGSGDVETLVELSHQWHRGILDVAQDQSLLYVLSIVPTDESH